MAKHNSLERECERLRKRVEELERQRKGDRRKLAALKTACDTYRQGAAALLKEHYPDDPKLWARELERALPLSAFIGELDEIVARKKKGVATRQRKPA